MPAPPTAIRVFLIAENRLLREALQKILEKKGDITVVVAIPATAATPEQLVLSDCDILLLSSSDVIPDHEFVRELRKTAPAIKVILIGMDANQETFFQAVRAGAVGYVLKDASAADLAAAVRGVANGEAVCPSKLCLSLFEHFARQWTDLPNLNVKVQFGLSRREQQLARLIAQGLTNKEIAAELGLSEQTVKNHVHHMLRKLGAADRLTFVERCREHGLYV